MRVLFKIAWRNIWRNKLRSLVIIVAIGFGLVGGLGASAWMNGMGKQRVKSIFSNEIAHIQIHNPEFVENLNVKKVISNTNQLLIDIYEIDEVVGVTSRLKTTAMASTASKNIGVTLIGVNAIKEKDVFGLYTKIDTLSGQYFDQKKRNAIIISKALAKELRVKVKSKIVLTFQDYNQQLTGAAFKIIGIFKTNNSSWDKSHVFVNNVDFKKLLAIPKNTSHEIDIKIEDFKKAQIIAAKLQQKYPSLLIEDWSKIQPYISFLTNYMDVMMNVFMIIILGALGFGIVNTMLMVILERTKELGMLMAIGMNKKRIFITIMLETILLTLIGAVIGELISMILINYFGVVGIDISSLAEGLESVGYSAITYPVLEFIKYLEITILVIITAVLASIYPAIKALRLDPAEAIRTI